MYSSTHQKLLPFSFHYAFEKNFPRPKSKRVILLFLKLLFSLDSDSELISTESESDTRKHAKSKHFERYGGCLYASRVKKCNSSNLACLPPPPSLLLSLPSSFLAHLPISRDRFHFSLSSSDWELSTKRKGQLRSCPCTSTSTSTSSISSSLLIYNDTKTKQCKPFKPPAL